MTKLTAAEKTARLIARNQAANAAAKVARAAEYADLAARLDAIEVAAYERDLRVTTLMGW